MEKILSISLELNFTPNNLGIYGLILRVDQRTNYLDTYFLFGSIRVLNDFVDEKCL